MTGVCVLLVLCIGGSVFIVRHFLSGKQVLTGKEGGDFLVISEYETKEAPEGASGEAEDSSAAAVSGSTDADSAAAGKEDPGSPNAQQDPIDQVQMLHLTEDQCYTGDLIMVNRSHAYDFDRNSESVQLVNIKQSQSFGYPVDREEFMIAKHVLKNLDAMIHDCDQMMGSQSTGISSAWRSYEYQQNLWDETVEDYGEDYAESYVARPGYSEHHTGLAVDLGIFYDDGSYGQFTDSRNAEWMAANCFKYGFIRRYAEDKIDITGISNEAWHFRYVGIPHAAYMYQNNLCLEEYLDYLREHTSMSQPLEIEYGYDTWSVFYSSDSQIVKPDHRYEVSGDNMGGYIITVINY